jgi:hypothetical protein
MANVGRAQGRKALKSASILGVDAHACVQRKAAAMLTLIHFLGALRVDQAALHKRRLSPSPAIGLRRRCCRLVVIAGAVKAHARWLVATRRRGAGVHHLKHTIDDDAMKMNVCVQARAEAVEPRIYSRRRRLCPEPCPTRRRQGFRHRLRSMTRMKMRKAAS